MSIENYITYGFLYVELITRGIFVLENSESGYNRQCTLAENVAIMHITYYVQ